MPPIVIFMPRGSASGTGWFRSFSHACINPISAVCAIAMRPQKIWSDLLAPCDSAHPAIFTACAWWPIMPDMNSMSAAVYGRRMLSTPRLLDAGHGRLTVGGVRGNEQRRGQRRSQSRAEKWRRNHTEREDVRDKNMSRVRRYDLAAADGSRAPARASLRKADMSYGCTAPRAVTVS